MHKEHLQRVEFRRLALYDSSDFNGVDFGYSDKSFLLSETNLCLKTWQDNRWNYDFSIGLLPIKRPPLNHSLPMAIRIAAAKKQCGMFSEKRYDVGFVARPTGDILKNERLRWLIDLKTHRPDLKFWGGLVRGKQWRPTLAQAGDGRIPKTYWLSRRKIGFFRHFAGLCGSKVALAPAGYAPWTYRHFEAIYAGCIVVCNDLSHYEFLVPFPRDGMIEVSDGGSVVAGIDAALALYGRSPEIVDANVEHLNQWLDEGSYSRRRRHTLARFFAELDVL